MAEKEASFEHSSVASTTNTEAENTVQTAVEIVKISEAKQFAKIIGQQTAQEILSYIGENKGCSASEIAKGLKIPLSTVHYNLKALAKAKIVDDNSFHYSSKGKEVAHYELAKKVIVIVPEKEPGLLTQLTAILPGLLIAGAIGAVALGTRLISKGGGVLKETAIAARDANADISMMVQTASESVQSAPLGAEAATGPLQQIAQSGLHNFFVGGLIAFGAIILGIVLFFLIKKTIRK